MIEQLFTDPKHRETAKAVKEKLEHAFNEHPRATGETYLEHLIFTTRMAVRFGLTSIIIFLHGIFPFIFTTTASDRMEFIYRVMKSRKPHPKLDDDNYDI